MVLTLAIRHIYFQYPTLGSNHRYFITIISTAATTVLSVSYSRIEPSLLYDGRSWQRMGAFTFSILLSDRTIATAAYPSAWSRGDILSVSYSRIEPSLHFSHTPEVAAWPDLSVSYSRIEPSLPCASCGLPGPSSAFQYPTLGSNHRYPRLPLCASGRARPFSILLSDRTIATKDAISGWWGDTSTFSILLSDRTIATPCLRRLSGRASDFQYPTLGSNHRY